MKTVKQSKLIHIFFSVLVGEQTARRIKSQASVIGQKTQHRPIEIL